MIKDAVNEGLLAEHRDQAYSRLLSLCGSRNDAPRCLSEQSGPTARSRNDTNI